MTRPLRKVPTISVLKGLLSRSAGTVRWPGAAGVPGVPVKVGEGVVGRLLAGGVVVGLEGEGGMGEG